MQAKEAKGVQATLAMELLKEYNKNDDSILGKISNMGEQVQL
jgi:hypothetical protein